MLLLKTTRRRLGSAQNYSVCFCMPESVSVVQTHSNRSKNKTFTIFTSNETVIILKYRFRPALFRARLR